MKIQSGRYSEQRQIRNAYLDGEMTRSTRTSESTLGVMRGRGSSEDDMGIMSETPRESTKEVREVAVRGEENVRHWKRLYIALWRLTVCVHLSRNFRIPGQPPACWLHAPAR
jgi:hypothetical protein